MDTIVVAEQGTHLLIGRGEKFAVVERRADQLFNCHDGSRSGIPAAELGSVDQILQDSDWTDKATAEATFNDIAERGTELANRMR